MSNQFTKVKEKIPANRNLIGTYIFITSCVYLASRISFFFSASTETFGDSKRICIPFSTLYVKGRCGGLVPGVAVELCDLLILGPYFRCINTIVLRLGKVNSTAEADNADRIFSAQSNRYFSLPHNPISNNYIQEARWSDAGTKIIFCSGKRKCDAF